MIPLLEDSRGKARKRICALLAIWVLLLFLGTAWAPDEATKSTPQDHSGKLLVVILTGSEGTVGVLEILLSPDSLKG